MKKVNILLLFVAPMLAQNFEVAIPLPEGPKVFGAANFRISASRVPLAGLRALGGDKQPEGTALYSITACNDGTVGGPLHAGFIIQEMERRGIGVVPSWLGPELILRSQNKSKAITRRLGEALVVAAPIVLSFAAGGTIKGLPTWSIGAITSISVLGAEVTKKTEPRNIAVPWLLENAAFYLGPNECKSVASFGHYNRNIIVSPAS